MLSIALSEDRTKAQELSSEAMDQVREERREAEAVAWGLLIRRRLLFR